MNTDEINVVIRATRARLEASIPNLDKGKTNCLLQKMAHGANKRDGTVTVEDMLQSAGEWPVKATTEAAISQPTQTQAPRVAKAPYVPNKDRQRRVSRLSNSVKMEQKLTGKAAGAVYSRMWKELDVNPDITDEQLLALEAQVQPVQAEIGV
jgi:hypothetical protein